jgi:hypothetical protein
MWQEVKQAYPPTDSVSLQLEAEPRQTGTLSEDNAAEVYNYVDPREEKISITS